MGSFRPATVEEGVWGMRACTFASMHTPHFLARPLSPMLARALKLARAHEHGKAATPPRKHAPTRLRTSVPVRMRYHTLHTNNSRPAIRRALE